MEPFQTLIARAVPLLRDNVDTDAIMPSREMRTVSKQGLADGLFAGWRYTSIGGRDPDPDFVLNEPARAGARILVSGENFGCGSSREHAVWALAEYGFRAIVAPSFNPIFRGNCITNGVLPVALDRASVERIAHLVEADPGLPVTVDLERQEIRTGGLFTLDFEIEPEARQALLTALDPIDQTLLMRDAIGAFRTRDRALRPWIYLSRSRREPAA